ncbi:MAG: hypothetical protein ACE365_04300 [Gammaproteobacteria bacterium]
MRDRITINDSYFFKGIVSNPKFDGSDPFSDYVISLDFLNEQNLRDVCDAIAMSKTIRDVVFSDNRNDEFVSSCVSELASNSDRYGVITDSIMPRDYYNLLADNGQIKKRYFQLIIYMNPNRVFKENDPFSKAAWDIYYERYSASQLKEKIKQLEISEYEANNTLTFEDLVATKEQIEQHELALREHDDRIERWNASADDVYEEILRHPTDYSKILAGRSAERLAELADKIKTDSDLLCEIFIDNSEATSLSGEFKTQWDLYVDDRLRELGPFLSLEDLKNEFLLFNQSYGFIDDGELHGAALSEIKNLLAGDDLNTVMKGCFTVMFRHKLFPDVKEEEKEEEEITGEQTILEFFDSYRNAIPQVKEAMSNFFSQEYKSLDEESSLSEYEKQKLHEEMNFLEKKLNVYFESRPPQGVDRKSFANKVQINLENGLQPELAVIKVINEGVTAAVSAFSERSNDEHSASVVERLKLLLKKIMHKLSGGAFYKEEASKLNGMTLFGANSDEIKTRRQEKAEKLGVEIKSQLNNIKNPL